VLVGGSEVILDCFDDVGLDVLLLLQGDARPVNQLSLLVVRHRCS
jgi:hypothetical protein